MLLTLQCSAGHPHKTSTPSLERLLSAFNLSELIHEANITEQCQALSL